MPAIRLRYNDGLLECPKCGSISTHLENVKQEPINGGQKLELEFSCEGCDGTKRIRHRMKIDSHKGLTNIRWV